MMAIDFLNMKKPATEHTEITEKPHQLLDSVVSVISVANVFSLNVTNLLATSQPC